MDSLPVEACLYAALLMVWSVHSQPSCDQTEFLHPNGTCVACPVCGPGEQLTEDCGFGDGGEGICIMCEQGTFSSDTSVAPCTRCTQCNLLNRLQKTGCSSTTDALCGQCLPGYYELRSMTGGVEPVCVPCYKHDTVHKECLLLTSVGSKADVPITATRENFQEPKEKRLKEDTFSVVLIGSATASSIFVIALLLWAFLLTAERFKHVPEYYNGSEGLLSAPLNSHKERIIKPPETPSQKPAHTDDPLRGLNSVSHENEVHPTSIVINVTTNIKSTNQNKNNTQENERDSCFSLEEMEQKLQKIWEVAQDQSIEMLDYDSVQDLSLLLDSADKSILRRLGRSLGVPPNVNTHLQGFQDLFQYLRTSTYTLLPQLAQAAALLPSPEVVARIHRAVVTK
ncbi:tumor necrosis factor receptor superfamily member EDAR-like [Sphaeramia orbicularis]|uniref:tumor necrosis factor receptor superfamily member EDAR-like n=1 Tax=Sphaeramia orbicularis TaxID=375764 RepID=UPI00117E1B74|nr:tumor necrosis factor receptor superfamily member EDAR-like [Sphaeramia orbicularis]